MDNLENTRLFLAFTIMSLAFYHLNRDENLSIKEISLIIKKNLVKITHENENIDVENFIIENMNSVTKYWE